jgi:hypothetical protein
LERRTYFDRDHSVPHGQLSLFEPREDYESRIVDESIDTTEVRIGELDDAQSVRRSRSADCL